MNESDRNRLLREIRFLVLAAKDMELVEGAVDLLTSSRSPVVGDPLIEAGLFTIYARPYTPDNKRRVLSEDWLPADPRDRKLHDRMIELRDTIYAHTDRDSPRRVEDVFGEHSYAESRPMLNPNAFPRLAALAQSQRDRFREGCDRRQEELRDDPPSSSIPPLLVRVRRPSDGGE
jgi:hypothetical protein